MHKIMSESFIKYPSTPHLMPIDKFNIRDDKIMPASDRDHFLQHKLIVEEKIDGSNLGISFDPDGNVRFQNRGSYLHLPNSGQWRFFNGWFSSRADTLFEYLLDRYILFGEWCYACHSVFYEYLPDWFIGFDIYDKISKSFLSVECRDVFLDALNVVCVPTIATGHFTIDQIKQIPLQSAFSSGLGEGLYLRLDRKKFLVQRAKFVRPDFIQSIGDHWLRSNIRPNRLTRTTIP